MKTNTKIMIPGASKLIVAAFLSAAWVRPAAPSTGHPPATDGEKLDYMIIQVNDQPRLVRDGAELAVVRGDRLFIKEAQLNDKTAAIREVNVVGYKSPSPKGEDRGYAFTTKDIKTKYSEDQKGTVFAILASGKTVLHGTVYLRIVEPVLRYAELSINGARRVLRDGEALDVKAADMVKVEQVVTNLDQNDGVKFQITAVDLKTKSYEIRFQRGGEAFARIPLRIEP